MVRVMIGFRGNTKFRRQYGSRSAKIIRRNTLRVIPINHDYRVISNAPEQDPGHIPHPIKLLLAVHFLGPEIERTFKAFMRYCKGLSGYLEVPAISALQLRKGKERVETHVLLVIVKARETILTSTDEGITGVITFRVEDLQCRTMKEMHDFLDYRAGPEATPELTEHTLAHRPGLLRIFVRDISGILPNPLDGYTLPTDISNWPPDYHRQYDANWREAFYTRIGQDHGDDPADAMALMPAAPFHQIGESNIGDLDLSGIDLEELLPPVLLEKFKTLTAEQASSKKKKKKKRKA
ncbi:hypothetical protein M413DRAFT_9703 [Hebeloma cylindrosporum]|uniref:Uncharacterized protein n=1 Tax=Hebeloma cylindrosporum TaxID=76867 RepID=A0A0C3C4J4_HEBCY|nr:hypothetical protein M413DRAFT_9703 [Hebeloma cylindrosporum h7]